MPTPTTTVTKKEKAGAALAATVERQTATITKADQAITKAFTTAYLAGLTLGEISERTGWSVDRIRLRIINAGVEMRARGRNNGNGG